MTQSAKRNTQSAYLEPMHSMGYLTRVNFRMLSKALEQMTLPYGVSAGQWRLLRVLWEEDNITQRELSRRTGFTEPTTVHAVRSLLNAGLAVRERSEQDKRKVFVQLTPRARKLRKKLLPMIVRVNEVALEGIDPDEVAITRKVLAQTYANMCAYLDEPET